MEHIDADKLRRFLAEIGSRYMQPAILLLLGGSALCLLGSGRPTVDVDYVGDDLHKDELQQLIDQVAHEMHIEVEAVPIAQFLPLPDDSEKRNMLVEKFGAIEVYILDPYTIALSKLDRGFDTDIEDVVFLIRRNLITLAELDSYARTALQRSHDFDLSASALREHLRAVQEQL